MEKLYESFKENNILFKSKATRDRVVEIALEYAKERCEEQKIKCAAGASVIFTKGGLTWNAVEEDIEGVNVSIDYQEILNINNVVDEDLHDFRKKRVHSEDPGDQGDFIFPETDRDLLE